MAHPALKLLASVRLVEPNLSTTQIVKVVIHSVLHDNGFTVVDQPSREVLPRGFLKSSRSVNYHNKSLDETIVVAVSKGQFPGDYVVTFTRQKPVCIVCFYVVVVCVFVALFILYCF